MSSSRSNESSSSAEGAAASPSGSGTTFAAASRRLNRRFTAYLDESFLRQARRRARRAAGLGGLAAALAGLAAYAAQAGQAEYWPLLLIASVLTACATALGVRGQIRDRREMRHVREVVQGGVPVNAFLVQANSALFKPQNAPLPCLVLLCFQPEVSSDIAYMRHLARRVYALKNTRQPDLDGRFVAGVTTNERAVPNRRRSLPLSFTDGSIVYCADLWVRPSYLKGACLQGDILPCIAEPGASGGIEIVPWWLLSDTEKPLAAASSSFGAESGIA